MRFGLVVTFTVLVGTLSAQAQPPRAKDKATLDKVPAQSSSEKTEKEKVGGKSLSQWRSELTSPDASKRAIAILAIMNFGEEAKEAVLEINARLRDDDLSPRVKACMALRVMEIDGKHVQAVVKALAHQVKVDPQAVVRYEAALTLRRFGPDAVEAIPALILGIKDEVSWEIRHMCIGTLWRVAQDPKNGPNEKAVEALVNRLNASRSSAVFLERLEMIIGLGSIGKPSNAQLHERVIKTLAMFAFSDPDRVSRSLALWAMAGLVSVGDEKNAEEALRRIGKFLNPPTNIDLRVQAIGALGALGSRSKKRIPDLMKLLSDKDAVIVGAAAASLAQITDNKDDKVLDALISTMTQNEKDPPKAAAAVIALVNLKANQKRVLDAMEKIRDKKGDPKTLPLRNLVEQGMHELKNPPKEKAKDK